MSNKNEFKSLAKESTIYFMADLLPRAVNFFLLPVYTYYLTKTDYGILSLAGTFGIFFQTLLLLQLDAAAIRFYFDYRDNPEKLKEFIGTILTFLLVLAVPISALVWFLGEDMTRLLIKDANFSFHPYVVYSFFLAFVYAIPQFYVQLYRAERKPWHYFAFRISSFLVTCALVVNFVVLRRQGAEGSLKGQCLGGFVFFVFYLLLFISKIGFRFNKKMLKVALRFSLPLVPTTLTGWLLFSMDRIIIERYLSLADLGIYAMAFNFCLILEIILTSFSTAYGPYCYDNISRAPEETKKVIARLGKIACAVGCCVVLIFICTIEILVRFMTAESYHSAYKVAECMALYQAFRIGWIVFSPTLAMFKKTGWFYWITLATGTVNLLIDLALIPVIGLYGAIVGTVISGGIMRVIIVNRLADRLYKVPYDLKKITLTFLLLLTCFALKMMANYIFSEQYSYLRICVSLSISPLFFLGLLSFGIISVRQLKECVSMIKQKFSNKL